MFIGVLIIIAFIIIAVLMATKKLPALFALPVMAIAVAVLARFPIMGEDSLFNLVLVDGTTYLAGTAFLIFIACWLSGIMDRTGVTQTLIKKAAELGGDKPVIIALLLCAVTAFLFTSLYGTGAAMMVSGVVLPIMLSIGVPPAAAANLFLMAFGIGYSLNTANMSALTQVAGIEFTDLRMPAIVLAAGAGIFIVVYLFFIFKKGAKKIAFAAPVETEEDVDEEEAFAPEKQVKGIRGMMACLTPLIIVVLTMVFGVPPMACFYIGILWLVIFTVNKNIKQYVNMLVTAFHEAGKDAAPPIGLCIGIGMALKAMTAARTQESIQVFMDVITPGTVFILVIFVIILAPGVLYRGPLNIYGLGAGLLACMITTGKLSPVILGAVFYSLCRWANDGCPTSTVVVYVSNYVGSDSITATNKLFLWRWALTAVTTIAVAVLLI
ncbi:MAG: hypothetical protein FWH16_01695 [Oscillospiraceae bacterium]|nr:hypothetical protein [Oscillospiraceae bacterium]